MKHEGAPIIDDGMPGVGTALIAHNDIGILGKQIDNLALAFITPLCADDYDVLAHLPHTLSSDRGVRLTAFRPAHAIRTK